MPRLDPIKGRDDVAAGDQHVVDDVQKFFGAIRGPFSMLWAAQVGFARRIGLREEVIDLIRAQGDPSMLPDEEREIVTYVRQLMRTNKIDRAAFDALRKRHDARWMVELTAAANYYALLCGMVNAFEVAAPPGGDTLPA
jgi:hypothetical protein